MSLVKATILLRSGQFKVHTSLINATITYGVSYFRNYSLLFMFSFSHNWNFYIPKVIKKVSIPLESMLLHGVIETKSTFLRDKLILSLIHI